MRTFVTTLFLFSVINIIAQTGSITNVQVSQRTDGSGLVDVYFDLSGPDEGYFIKFRLSFDGGQIYWAVEPTTMTGDVGPMDPGNGKHIVWDPMQQFPDRYSPQSKLKIIAYIMDMMNPCPGTPAVTDYDGNIYYTVQIGDQCWMNENLNSTRTATGLNITRYCSNNEPGNCENYGGLYTWSTLMNGAVSSNNNPSGVQGICPNGWHVPSDAEWTELTDYLINNYVDINSDNIGNKLKSCRQINSPIGAECNTSIHPRWEESPDFCGTNDFGFSGLPGGSHYSILGFEGHWWSSSENYPYSSWSRQMAVYNGLLYRYERNKVDLISVRCVKD